ncbi:MAG TPA: glycosyltransferase [Mariniphaga anaerophila]|uniref:Glycosyltransferase n=1 Tax=Mariniphaga anaerophila TaxID=1484053 RepID=A0A831LB24_9BACT|nr:glycosyltransferase [Mariniphaga anaerophila]
MNNKNIIVSCTTTKDRLHMLYYMIQSIKNQELMPNILYINISRENYLYDNGIYKVPKWLNQNFIRINQTDNIGSYRKLLPIIKIAKDNDLIITADDDILYGQRWIKSLVELAENYPKHIVCARAREMKKNIFGIWQNYSLWSLISSAKDGILILPTGGAGAVYRKELLDLSFLLDPAFKKLAPTTDDLWVRMASMKINVPVYVEPSIDMENIYLKQDKSLYQVNQNAHCGYIEKIYENTFGLVRDWLGINATENDRSWSRIVKYSAYSKIFI